MYKKVLQSLLKSEFIDNPISDRKPHFIFSAENPLHPGQQTLKLNHNGVMGLLRKKGYHVEEMQGKYGQPEKSILVYNPSKHQAKKLLKLSASLGQDSSIYSDGYNHEMHFHYGDNRGLHRKGQGTEHHKKVPKDFYSIMQNNHIFTHNIDETMFHQQNTSMLHQKPMPVNKSEEDNGSTIKLHHRQILADRKGVERASSDIRHGRKSKTSGPLHVHKLKDGRHLLVDGYHRFAHGLVRGKKHFKVKIVSRGYSSYYATPSPEDEFKKSEDQRHPLETAGSDTNLIHYSSIEGLRELDPKLQGSTPGARDKSFRQGKPFHPMTFFYLEGTHPEPATTSGATHKYVVKLGDMKLYDIGKDPEGIHKKLSETTMGQQINRGIVSREDFHNAIKEAGYHGLYNSKMDQDNMKRAVGLFVKSPVFFSSKIHPKDFKEASATDHYAAKTDVTFNPNIGKSYFGRVDLRKNKSKDLPVEDFDFESEGVGRSKKPAPMNFNGAHPNSYAWHDGHTDHHEDIFEFEHSLKNKKVKKAENLKNPQKPESSQLQIPQQPIANEQADGNKSGKFHSVMGKFGTITSGKPTNLKFYQGIEKYNDQIDNYIKNVGHSVYFVGGKRGKPDLANKNYNTKHLMIYDLTEGSDGDFGNEQFIAVWRKVHEIAHAETYEKINKKYGEGKRLGKLGIRSAREMKRAVEWEWHTVHRQRQIMEGFGHKISDEDFHRELNTVMGDAVHRAITGQFTDPHKMGFSPHAKKSSLEDALKMIDDHAEKLGLKHDDDTFKLQRQEGIKKSIEYTRVFGMKYITKAEADFREPKKIERFDIDPSDPSMIHADYHGFGGAMNSLPGQKDLIHGLDSDFKVAEHRGSSTEMNWTPNILTGEQALIKLATGIGGKGFVDAPGVPPKTIQEDIGHLDVRGFNSARREVMFHNLAHEFFGLGSHVPTTAGFTKQGEDYSAQRKVNGHEAKKLIDRPEGPSKKIVDSLKNHHMYGALHKLAIMDIIMSNHDRSGNNFMIDKDVGSKIHLIDNSGAFEYSTGIMYKIGGVDVPKYLDYAQELGISNEIHPKAKKWLNELPEEKALQLWDKYGFDKDHSVVKGFLLRLSNLKYLIKHPPEGESTRLGDVLKRVYEISDKRVKAKNALAITQVSRSSMFKEIRNEVGLPKPVSVSNEIDKGELSNRVKTGLATLAVATNIAATTPVEAKTIELEHRSNAPITINHDQHQTMEDDKNKILSAISQVESSGGKQLKHSRTPASSIHRGARAYGKYALTPLIIKETIKKHKNLAKKYSHILKLSDEHFYTKMKEHPSLEYEIASKHYDRLAKRFGHNPAKIGYAWLNGIQGTLNAINSGKNINDHWHVQKILRVYNAIKSGKGLVKNEEKKTIMEKGNIPF